MSKSINPSTGSINSSIGLASPWVSYVHKVKALFDPDPEITIKFDENELILSLFVEDAIKADALMQLLPSTKEFGNVTLQINVIPANGIYTTADLFAKAFHNNPILSQMIDTPSIFSNPVSYMLFRNEVVQYYNDNLNDYYGFESTLYEDLARDVFEGKHSGVFFCTDLPVNSD